MIEFSELGISYYWMVSCEKLIDSFELDWVSYLRTWVSLDVEFDIIGFLCTS